MIYSAQNGLGSSCAQDVLLCGSLGEKRNCKENKPELEGLPVSQLLLMLLQPEGDTSLGLLTNHMKNHLIPIFLK